MSLEKSIFQKGSTTYYWSSAFFPRAAREDVYKLYSFVRVVDDLVDAVPQDIKTFQLVEQCWQERKTLNNGTIPDQVLGTMLALLERYKFPSEWVDAFMQSMRWDTTQRTYQSLDDSLQYVYGSAEVIGLMMAKILRLPDEAITGARYQGRAMQWINFCRDLQEDISLGRCYFPRADLESFGLPDLQAQTTMNHRQQFIDFMRLQLDRYIQWQHEADKAYTYLPRRMRIPVQTASSMYNWTAEQIRIDPFVVYAVKVKPTKGRIIRTALAQELHG